MQQVTITGGGFQNALGTALAAGYLRIRLLQDVTATTAQIVAGTIVRADLDSNGNVSGTVKLWGPTTYLMKAYDVRGELVWQEEIAVPDASSFSLTP